MKASDARPGVYRTPGGIVLRIPRRAGKRWGRAPVGRPVPYHRDPALDGGICHIYGWLPADYELEPLGAFGPPSEAV